MTAAVTISDLDQLLATVRARSHWAHSALHGEQHWQAVTYAGLRLAHATVGADPVVVFLFGLFHDAQRINDWDDPQHGPRAAALVRDLHGQAFTLAPAALEQLCAACTDHDRGLVSDDPTIGCCWDADRLNLWRVGVRPDPTLLSTEAARAIAHQMRDLHTRTYDWHALYEDIR